MQFTRKKIYISPNYEFDGEGTPFIWGGSVILSAYRFSFLYLWDFLQ
ncbi:MAG: hypothetical protein IPL26_05480 [Leptospiraceae bacterium]|nr:hypothetical protein [Leptospiraceae bacterium]